MWDFHRAEDRGSAVACDVVVGAGAYSGFAELLESIRENVGGGGAESGGGDLFAEAGLIVAFKEDHIEARAHVHDRDGNGDATGVRLLSSAALALLLPGHVVGRTFGGVEAGGIDEIEVHGVVVIPGGRPAGAGAGAWAEQSVAVRKSKRSARFRMANAITSGCTNGLGCLEQVRGAIGAGSCPMKRSSRLQNVPANHTTSLHPRRRANRQGPAERIDPRR